MEKCQNEDECLTPMWCRGKDTCQKQVESDTANGLLDAADCSSCAFWLPHSESTRGKCRRMPPQQVAYVETKRDAYSQVHVETYSCTEFPETLATEWCGEHQTNVQDQTREE